MRANQNGDAVSAVIIHDDTRVNAPASKVGEQRKLFSDCEQGGEVCPPECNCLGRCKSHSSR